MKKINELFRLARLEKGISQGTLARKLGYANGQFISNFERGVSPLPLKQINAARKILGIDKGLTTKTLLSDFENEISVYIK